MKKNLFLLCLLISFFLKALGIENFVSRTSHRQEKSLLFPQYSTLQTSMCLIAQISSLPSHRVALNIGFQINYSLPYELPSFYSPIFWARKLSKTSNPLVNFFERMAENDMKGSENFTTETTQNLLETTSMNSANTDNMHERKKRMLPFDSDISAGVFYNGIIDVLDYGGYHEDCLLKSVCELAKHPLHFEDENEDVTKELLHFLLTPSAHNSFDPENEAEDKVLYEEAERLGKEGMDCEIIFSDCKTSPLYFVSDFVS